MRDDFLLACREAYFKDIFPAMPHLLIQTSYVKIIGIAQRYFEGGREAEFFQLAQEGHYFINLWAAHMLIEYGKPTPELQAKALDIINFHSATYCTPGNTVNRVVAQQEDQWLDDYNKRKNPVSCN